MCLYVHVIHEDVDNRHVVKVAGVGLLATLDGFHGIDKRELTCGCHGQYVKDKARVLDLTRCVCAQVEVPYDDDKLHTIFLVL